MTPRFLGKFRFCKVFTTLTLAGSFATATFAASVGPGGYTNDFSGQPAVADWSSYASAGANSTIGTIADLDAAVEAVGATDVSMAVNSDSANPPLGLALANWSSTGFYVQTRPTGVA